ncbi:MAG: tetratricopeptide repeat protein [Deltaproteobacteria bacterium]|jgi:tetratricopeptide (TPR) repeat protein|nr:tetratricopeptide repeat protein [Deltaproteobacteria bacterium]MBW2535129.1 tetratricopeptide repeat protein [Deltaproteobacteria bacterium]
MAQQRMARRLEQPRCRWVGSRLLRRPFGFALAAALVLGTVSRASLAEDAAEALRIASRQVDAVNADVGAIERVIKTGKRETTSAERRIGDATMLMGIKDYERAADVLNQLVELYPDHPTAYADGVRLLAETYFLSKQYVTARRVYQRIIESTDDRRFMPYREQAAVRLVDVALRTGDVEPLGPFLDGIAAEAASSSAVSYALGKGRYALRDWAGATAALGGVDGTSEYAHQARFLRAVIAVKEAAPDPVKAPGDEVDGVVEVDRPRLPRDRFDPAIAAFLDVTKLPADSVEHRHVIALAWMALGRLYYETDRWREAVDAYNHIDRDSPEFGPMLYELAWVYVRLGDVVRARRALEVLAVAAPKHQDIADAQLLRGDLMLRAGMFDKSLKVYESVRGTYETMRERVDDFLRSTTDPGAYFDTLNLDQLELFESGAKLPVLAVRWAKEGEDGTAAFAVVDDITICRRLIRESNEMIDRLNAVLASPNRVRALPGLKVGAEKGLSLHNTLARVRLRLAHGLDDVADEDELSRPLRDARKRRRALERRLSMVPVSAAEFEKREEQARRQWNKASQALQRLQLELDTVQATINGLERMLQDGPQAGVVRDPARQRQLTQELGVQQRNVEQYRQSMTQLRRAVEAGRVQAGFGDKRFVEDAEVRKRFRDLLWREVQLSQGGGGGADLAAYAQLASPLLRKADTADQKIAAALARLNERVSTKADELRDAVRQETANLVEYAVVLEALDRESRMVVGEVAMRNFANVRDRLKNIVLRADVGITEEAWEVREEQLTRVRRLRIERARGERRLREELSEVLDDSGEPEAEP